MNEQDWGPWTEHDGKGCPLRPWEYAQAECADGYVGCGCWPYGGDTPPPGTCSYWLWSSLPSYWWHKRVIRYRVRKPRGLVILENMLADLPEGVDA